MEVEYWDSLTTNSRFISRVVKIGDIAMGGSYPIRVQSMTNTDTLDTDSTVSQVIQLANAGCEIVRIATPDIKEAENLKNIKKSLEAKGVKVPLVADVHFNPKIAEQAAGIVEKVRINPGNYADKKQFRQLNYTNSEYYAELERIHERVLPLIKICKEYGTAIRIGVNHGSLSDRIISHYGDTPTGMVKSAVEFINIFRDLGFHDIVLSMKASNVISMIHSTRLLVHMMLQNEWDYPIHLGVTEAGGGEDGRIKSAAGIGTLLHEGIGDTIRVSLTEDPVAEIPVAQLLASRFNELRENANSLKPAKIPFHPFSFSKQRNEKVNNTKEKIIPVVISDEASDDKHFEPEPDFWYLPAPKAKGKKPEKPTALGFLKDKEGNKIPLIDAATFTKNKQENQTKCFIQVKPDKIPKNFFETLQTSGNNFLIIESDMEGGIHATREFIFKLIREKVNMPVIIKLLSDKKTDVEQLIVDFPADAGALAIDRLIDGIWLHSVSHDPGYLSNLSFDILQAVRARISKTEYISCPTCARTTYNIFETLDKIKAATAHLKGLKIAVMGCIVNGPGEMADADYGYIGMGKGKICLYKGKYPVKKNIDERDAVAELINLIKESGDWQEPGVK